MMFTTVSGVAPMRGRIAPDFTTDWERGATARVSRRPEGKQLDERGTAPEG